MADIDYDKMWKEIIEIGNSETHILPGEKTLKMITEETGMTENQARTFIKRMIEAKKLSVRTVQIRTARVNVYSPILHNEK